MRNVLFLIIAAAAFASQSRPDERPWSVGYAEADITPAPGQVQMSGFGRERYARGALASLLTQVVVLRDGEDNTGVLIAADILDLDRVMVEAIRRTIRYKHGIPADDLAARILAPSTVHRKHRF
ncbi:MAG TPA: hypothetical protein VMX36_00085 [Sedimentisphaerales bacterium]|nr:hypothetical protein [Sedimentisphaerales bacterium]